MQGAHEDGRWVKSSCRCREAPRPEDDPMQTDGKTCGRTVTKRHRSECPFL